MHENTKYQFADFCPQRELSVYDKKGFALLWVSYQMQEKEKDVDNTIQDHAHADAFACYMQIVFVITEAVSSEMSLNLLMCIG